jgi:hypothetical protein
MTSAERDYARDCIPEITPRDNIIANEETAEMVAESLLENWPPEEGLDRDECRQALVERIEVLTR